MQRLHMLSSDTLLKLIKNAHRDLHIEQDTPQNADQIKKQGQ